MDTNKKREKKATYAREYASKNKDRINTRRRERRLERIAAGEDVNALGRARNITYYNKHRDDLIEKGKALNWNYDAERRIEIRKRYYTTHPARSVLRSRKSRALKSGLPFELTEEWYEAEFLKGCAMTGIQFAEPGSDLPWVAHVDRIIPEKGYTIENCRLVCAVYNLAKKHWADGDVLKMAQALVGHA